MVKMIAMKCPECKANLNIEEGRTSCFCSYCGTKIIIDDGSKTYIYRNVDEARIKEAEVDETIRLKELELENRRLGLKHWLIKIWIIVVILIAIVGIVLLIIEKDDSDSIGGLLLLWDVNLLMWPGLMLYVNGEKK